MTLVRYSSRLPFLPFAHFHSKTSSSVSRPPSSCSGSSPHSHRQRWIWRRGNRKSDRKAERSVIRKRSWRWGGGWAGGRKLPTGDCRYRNRCGQTHWTEESAEITQGTNGQRERQRTKCVLFWWCHHLSFWSGIFHTFFIQSTDHVRYYKMRFLTILFHCNRKLPPMSWALQHPPVQLQYLSKAPSWICMVSSNILHPQVRHKMMTWHF